MDCLAGKRVAVATRREQRDETRGNESTHDCFVVNPRNQRPGSAMAEQLNEAQQLQLEQLRYIEEQLAAKVLSEECLRLIQNHRVVGSGLRNENLATLGPYPETLEEQEDWNKRKADVEARVEAHLAAAREREGLKEAWETWCDQEKLKALRENLIHQQQQQHQMAGMAQAPVPGYAQVPETHQASAQGAYFPQLGGSPAPHMIPALSASISGS
jgi:hypothetical protein